MLKIGNGHNNQSMIVCYPTHFFGQLLRWKLNMAIENLKPAGRDTVIPYSPYAPKEKSWLPLAISLYKEGRLEGQRPIEGGKPIPFIATWTISSLPLEQTRLRLQFEGSAEHSYEISLQNADFICHLISVIKNYHKEGVVDFPKDLYRALLKISTY